jgi:hypothetical protein
MQRRHFEIIAELLIETRQYVTSDKRYGLLCNMWSDELAKHNPAFNRYTFLKACGAI